MKVVRDETAGLEPGSRSQDSFWRSFIVLLGQWPWRPTGGARLSSKVDLLRIQVALPYSGRRQRRSTNEHLASP